MKQWLKRGIRRSGVRLKELFKLSIALNSEEMDRYDKKYKEIYDRALLAAKNKIIKSNCNNEVIWNVINANTKNRSTLGTLSEIIYKNKYISTFKENIADALILNHGINAEVTFNTEIYDSMFVKPVSENQVLMALLDLKTPLLVVWMKSFLICSRNCYFCRIASKVFD